jgi:hypothetical protein
MRQSNHHKAGSKQLLSGSSWQKLLHASSSFLVWLLLGSCKWRATRSPKTSVGLQQTTWRYIPDDRIFHYHRFEKLKSYKLSIISLRHIA